MVKTAKLWNGNMSVGEIAKELKLSGVTVRKYLKNGVSQGLCVNYNESESKRRAKLKCIKTNKLNN